MSTINPDKINKLTTSIYSSFAFLAGMQLDIFTLIDNGPLTIKDIAAKINVKPNYIERLLYSLVSAELLTVKNGLFNNAKDASHYLVKGKPSYMGDHTHVLVKN